MDIQDQEELINHIKDSGALITDDTVYKTDYSAEQPYSAGVKPGSKWYLVDYDLYVF